MRAAADTLALSGIAERREADTRALVASVAPGTVLAEGDVAGSVADLLPEPGAGGGVNAFLGTAARISAALAPLGVAVSARAMSLQGGQVTMDVEASDPALAGRISTALKDAGIAATVTATAGGIRISAPAA